MPETPAEAFTLVDEAKLYLDQARDHVVSSVPVTISRALAEAQIASTLLQLHELEQIAAPPYIDALAQHTQTRDYMALRTVKAALDSYELEQSTAAQLIDQLREIMREAGLRD